MDRLSPRLFFALASVGAPLTAQATAAAPGQPASVPTCAPSALVETLREATPGTGGLARLEVFGLPAPGRPFALVVRGRPGAHGCLLSAPSSQPTWYARFCATLVPAAPLAATAFTIADDGTSAPLLETACVPVALCGLELFAQSVILDPEAKGGVAFTNGLRLRVGTAADEVSFAAGDVVPFEAADGGPFTSRNDLAVGDVTGDQVPDLVVAGGTNTSGELVVIAGRVGGGFEPPVALGAFRSQANSVVLVDLDGDGLRDIAAASPFGTQPRLAVIRSLGGGTFAPRVRTFVGPIPSACAAADLDGDGDTDLVLKTLSTDSVAVVRNRGDGTFDPHVTFGPRTHTGDDTDGIGVADFDGDGWMDIVAGSSSSSVHTDRRAEIYVLPGRGGGAFGAMTRFPSTAETNTGVLDLEVADVDRDGLPDVVALNSTRIGFVPSNTSFSVFLGRGDGTFEAPIEHALPGKPMNVEVADLDRDGELDLAFVVNDPREAHVFVGCGDGRFQAGPQVALPFAARGLAVDDVDGDLLGDLVTLDFGVAEVTVRSNLLID